MSETKAGISIIKRDIDFYKGEVERYTVDLQRCQAQDELFYKMRRHQAQMVVDALERLNTPLENVWR
jgi:hypothetical protein